MVAGPGRSVGGGQQDGCGDVGERKSGRAHGGRVRLIETREIQ